ncbi:MAG: hypothetical protein DI536_01315 [Archangium gephyra]|uniref:Uncharacterized protein n=1 Tax=Archangium gephyra TaxID=48 RepID=A0A2W5TWP2_9BACT|nr:MAG: hypothetical protein DI536_01315 [Archangium gephyra]
MAKGDVRRLSFDPLDAKKCHAALNALERYRAELARGYRGIDLKQFDGARTLSAHLRAITPRRRQGSRGRSPVGGETSWPSVPRWSRLGS